MTITLAQSLVATAQCMSSEDAIDFITERVTPSELVDLLTGDHEVRIIPSVTKCKLYPEVQPDE